MKKLYFIVPILFIGLLFLAIGNKSKHVSVEKSLEPEISINIPSTKYTKLNNLIKEKITKIKAEFEDMAKNNFSKTPYTLSIDYKEYNYYNFISYVFFIETDLGGAHPSHDLFTIIFNKENNTFVDINTLIKYNPKTLKVFSNYSRTNLIYDTRVVDVSMLLEGTTPKVDNFTNFIFSDNIIIFFKEYQIAPYSSGTLTLDVPYYMIK